jgi:hypothetical protein
MLFNIKETDKADLVIEERERLAALYCIGGGGGRDALGQEKKKEG